MGKLLTWWVHLRLRSTLAVGGTALLVLIGTCAAVVHAVEGWSWVDSLYFAVVSITTVGYGDLAPSHDATKLFLIVYLPVGIGLALTVLASLGAAFLAAQRRRVERVHAAMGEHPGHEGGAT